MGDTYRKYWLINSLGERYDLTNNKLFHFLNQPEGLGFERQYTSEKVGNSEIITSQSFNLTDISGEIVFYNNTNGLIYQDYQDFIQFAKYKPLELHLLTPNSLDDYYCEVLFIIANKKDTNYEDNANHVGVTFHRLTQWLTSNDYNITLRKETSVDGKYYPLVRPYHYSGTTLSNTPIVNNGTDDIGFIFTIDGYVQNPVFTLTQAGEQYGIFKLNGSFDYVQINSVEQIDSLYLENNGSVIANPERYQDFSIANGQAYLTWCKFRVGESIFNFTCGNIDTFNGTINISFKNSFVTV